MRYSRFFRILALAVIISLLIIAIPVKPALALTVITLSPTSGSPGTPVTLAATGLKLGGEAEPYEGKAYILFDVILVKPPGSDQYGGINVIGGALTTTFNVPGGTAAGSFWVKIQTAPQSEYAQILGTATFTVLECAITLSPATGVAGDTILISGNGFRANDTVTIKFGTTSVGTIPTTTTGTFGGSFIVPQSCRGEYTIEARDTGNTYDTATFTVAPEITISSAAGSVGDVITISGDGFSAGSLMTFYFDNVSVSVGTVIASDKGSFTNIAFTIPAASQGGHIIKVQDGTANYATATFAVALKITVSPTAGGAGTSVSITGIGFNASHTITIKYNGVVVATIPATITTNTTGGFTASFIVPVGITGSYLVEASDGANITTTSFAYTTNVTLSQETSLAAPGYVGMEVTVTGAGFAPEAPVTISYASTPIILANVFTDASGSFAVTVTIPPSPAGQHTLTVTDGTLTEEFTFFMETAAPSAPKLLMPPADGEAKSATFFNWDDAEDDSLPLTYELQIATDADFSDVFLEITGLEESSYTLSGDEKLKPAEEDTPYYWRVRAIDAATNAGAWTDYRKFYVSSTSWVIYALISAGVLLIFFLGFWAGRRSKREYYY